VLLVVTPLPTNKARNRGGGKTRRNGAMTYLGAD